MKNLLIRQSSGKRVLIWFLLANLFYVLMVAVSIPKVMSFANGMKILDMLPGGYNFEYANTLLDELGEPGRNAYLFRQIPLDMFYPFLFAGCYSLLFVFFLKKIEKQNSSLFLFSFLPFIAGLADYAENIGIINLLIHFPDISEKSVQLCNTFSLIKSSSTIIYYVALLIVMVWTGINWIRQKK